MMDKPLSFSARKGEKRSSLVWECLAKPLRAPFPQAARRHRAGLFLGREKSWPGCREPSDRSDQGVSARPGRR